MYGGPWKAKVARNDDPEKRGRVCVQIFDAFQDEDNVEPPESDWVEPKYPHFARKPPPVGAGTWVEPQAPGTSMQNLVWCGSYDISPSGISSMPALAQQTPPGVVPLDRGLRTADLPDFQETFGDNASPALTIAEAPFDQRIEYPQCLVEQETPGGMARAKNETPGSRAQLEYLGAYQREVTESGAIRERGGSSTTFLDGDRRAVVEGSDHELVAGDVVRSVEGDVNAEVDGTAYLKAGAVHLKVGPIELKFNIDPGVAGSLKASGPLDLSVIGQLAIAALTAAITALKDLKFTSLTGDADLLAGDHAGVHGVLGARVTAGLGGKVRVAHRVMVGPVEFPGVIRSVLLGDAGDVAALLAHTHPSPGAPPVYTPALKITPATVLEAE